MIEWLERELDGRRSRHGDRSATTGAFCRTCRASPSGSIAGRRGGSSAASASSRPGATHVLEEEERDQHKLDRKIVAEEHWLRYGVTGRRKRNVKRLGTLQELRQTRNDYRGAAGSAVVTAAEAAQSGSLVIEAKNLSKAYDGRADRDGFLDAHPARRPHRHRRPQRQRQDHADQPAHRHAGARQRHGAARRQSGRWRRSSRSATASIPTPRLAETLTGGHGDTVMVGDQPRHVIGYMKDFLFAPEQARTPLRVLSGGERGRLMLALALAKPSNVLVLDEPTNDLDLETLDVLEEMLGAYAGTVLVISHDRDFLDRVVSGVIMPEGDGRWLEYAGGYSDMLAQRGADLARLPVAKAGGEGQAGTRERRARAAASASSASTRSTRSRRCRRPSPALQTKIHDAAGDAARSRPVRARPRGLRRGLAARSPTRRPSWRRRKRNGWRWRSCARRSRAECNPSPSWPELVPAIHVLLCRGNTWMPGTWPRMTRRTCFTAAHAS